MIWKHSYRNCFPARAHQPSQIVDLDPGLRPLAACATRAILRRWRCFSPTLGLEIWATWKPKQRRCLWLFQDFQLDDEPNLYLGNGWKSLIKPSNSFSRCLGSGSRNESDESTTFKNPKRKSTQDLNSFHDGYIKCGWFFGVYVFQKSWKVIPYLRSSQSKKHHLVDSSIPKDPCIVYLPTFGWVHQQIWVNCILLVGGRTNPPE